jgi:hypothetical protein
MVGGLVGAVIGLGVLAGCGAGGDGDAIRDQIDDSTAEGRAALAMDDCLASHEIPARLGRTTSGVVYVSLFPDGDGHVYLRYEGASQGRYGGLSGRNQADEAVEAALDASGAAIGFALNGEDRTADFTACLDLSGYDLSAGSLTADSEAKLLAFTMAQGTEWTSCAREHGLPDLGDPEMVDGEPVDVPRVNLPASITPDQLRVALTACPFLTEEALAYQDEVNAELNPDMGLILAEFSLWPTTPDPDARQELLRLIDEEFRWYARQSYYDRQASASPQAP